LLRKYVKFCEAAYVGFPSLSAAQAIVGAACRLELLIDDIREELRGRPYEIVGVAGGWSFRTRHGFGEAIRAALGGARERANCRGRTRCC